MTLVLTPAHAAGPGKWTPKVMWDTTAANDSSTAIHMLLLRGDGSPYHSRLMWFGGEPLEVFKGGIWGWNPGNEDCEEFPSGSLSLITPPIAGHNVFCSGHSGLADGRVLLAGGHSDVTGAFGVPDAAIHTIGSGSGSGAWDSVDPMQAWRWYPTNTTLKDGRVLVTAGFQHRQHRMFGGRLGGSAPSSPSADTVRRWAPTEGGAWDPPVRPLPDTLSNPQRPVPCEGLTGTALLGVPNFQGKVLFFGGRQADSTAVDHLWTLERRDNPTGADYEYQWERRTPDGEGPSPRSEHSASLGRDKVYIFGGRESDGEPTSDAFIYTAQGAEGTWAEVEIDSGVPPSPRMGHIAFFNEMAIRENDEDKYVRRLIVYGGVASAGSTPTDKRVYELRLTSFDPPHGYWREMADTSFSFAGHSGGQPLNAPPAPRYWHRVASRGDSVQLAGLAPRAKISFVVGGALGNNTYSDSLWMMCVFASNKVGWALRDLGGDTISARARFSMAFDIEQGTTNGAPRLYVHGGEGASGLADPGVYVCDPYFFGSTQWTKWGEAGYSATGHVSVSEEDETHARYGEIFDPSNGTWTRLSGALLEHSYPVTFAVSGGSTAGGRVVTASSWDDKTRYVDLPGPGSSNATWAEFPNGTLGFLAETGVLYRPDKLLIAGGAVGTTVVGTSKTLDATNTSNAWESTATMRPRFYHNLVLLPDGKVLATGGATRTDDYNNFPVREPQIWDPGGGTWTDSGTLDSSTAIRGYHSTSVLLPDGRVVCAGGWGSGGEGGGIHPDQVKADFYCPPYLFNANGSLANRPVILEAPETLNYNERFSLCLESDSVTLGSVTLLRPGMTTHAFDQNQRYVPLTWALEGTTTGEKRTYSVIVPWMPSQAPPGDYLLFAVNGAGTPGIARWVRLGVPSGDTLHPEQVTTLEKVCSYGESIDLRWHPPAGDSAASQDCPSPVQSYEMRYSTSSMTTWEQFQAGTLATTPSVPAMPGPDHWDTATLTGLTPDTRYYIRMVSKDYAGDASNWSAMSPQTSFMSTYQECGEFAGGGGGGGGSSAHRSTGPTSARAGTSGSSLELNTLLANAPAGTSRTDRMHLPHGPEWTGEAARVRLARTGTRGTHVERVRLLSVDVPAGSRAYARGEGLVTGTPAAPVSVTHADGRALAGALAEGAAFSGTERDTVHVVLGGEGPGTVALSTEGAQLVHPPSQSGIDVQCREGEEWVTVARHHPRARGGEEVFDVPDVTAVRLVFLGEHRLLGVAGLADASVSVATEHEPVSASHSVDGPVTASLAGDGVTLDPDEALLVDFASQPAPEGVERVWFLEVTAVHAAPPASVPSASGKPAERPTATLAFALRQNRPNPLANSTTIGFDLPARSRVELTVFDLLGRRVVVLAEREFDPGRHELAWDRTDLRGRAVRPGVYIYRLIAGSHREQRTMVVVR